MASSTHPDELKAMLDASLARNPENLGFQDAKEAERFKKAFEDPEFLKMFSEYMDELQDPNHRAEQEAYISQLEGEEKIPQNKELIRPKPGFVAKTRKTSQNSKGTVLEEKLFINIVSSDLIQQPRSQQTKDGTNWALPYSLGPPHMEKDKNGDNVTCFDCCYHPDALQLGSRHKQFRTLLVETAMDGVVTSFAKQNQKVTLNKDFHILKGINYKSGQVPTMLIDKTAKASWGGEGEKDSSTKTSSTSDGTTKPVAAPMSNNDESKSAKKATENAASTTDKDKDKDAASLAPVVPSAPAKSATKVTKGAAAAPAVKAGFLNKNKGPGIYDDMADPSPTTMGGRKALVEDVTGKVPPTKPQPPPAASTTSSTQQQQTFAPLMKEASTTKITRRPVDAQLKDQVKQDAEGGNLPSTSIASNSPTSQTSSEKDDSKQPKYTVTERGIITMGDFEALKGKVASTRPAELVYKIEVPLIAKASMMVLDVAERSLHLTYESIYDLKISLPYPVFDKKGAAKYDKQFKCLTVTLPVLPPPLQPEAQDASPTSASKEDTASEVSTHKSQQQASETTENAMTANPKSPVQSKREDKVHSRWVSTVDEEERERSAKLKKEVEEQAEAARIAALSAPPPAPVTPAPSNPLPPSPPTAATSTSTKAAVPFPDATGNFIACASFVGSKPNYYFTLGPQGLGYYKDSTSIAHEAGAKNSAILTTSSTSTSTSTSSKPTGDSIENAASHTFSFETQQNKATVSILIQVSMILAGSANVTFHPNSLDVSFTAMTQEPESKSGEEKDGQLRNYSMSFKLSGSIVVNECKFDVAMQNMVIVLVKADEKMWPEPYLTKTTKKRVSFTSPASDSIASSGKPAATPADASSQNTVKTKELTSAIESLKFTSSPALFDLD